MPAQPAALRSAQRFVSHDGKAPFPSGGEPPLTAVGRLRAGVTGAWPLALLSFGQSWHNIHHSDPVCARHGAGPRQVDISAAVIRVFERLGWATAVRWPDPVRLAARRRPSAQDRPRAALPPPGR